jgi:hypothetical protein
VLIVTDTASMSIALVLYFKRNVVEGSKNGKVNAKVLTHEEFMRALD